MVEDREMCGGCDEPMEWCQKHLVYHHSEDYDDECLESQIIRDMSPFDYTR